MRLFLLAKIMVLVMLACFKWSLNERTRSDHEYKDLTMIKQKGWLQTVNLKLISFYNGTVEVMSTLIGKSSVG